MTAGASEFVKWFRAAAPYIHVHRGKTFVIQFEDEAIQSETFIDLIHDLALFNGLGIQLVLVFGSQHTIEKRLQENSLASQVHNGTRITDAGTLRYVKEVVGMLRIEIESTLSMGLGNTPMSNADIRVSSGNFITAKPMGVIDGIDYQYSGEIRHIDVDAIRMKLITGEIVLIPPLGYSTTGETFNLRADVLAAKLAAELQADKLIFLMEHEGLVDKSGNLIRQLNRKEAESLFKESEDTSASKVDRYIQLAIEAVEQGIQRIHLIDRRLNGAVLQELFTRDGAGTMISSTSYDVLRQANIDDIAGILALIEPLEKKGVLVERSREKLELEVDHFIILERDRVIIGCAALYPFKASNACELACLVVHPEYHNGGRGEQLLSAIENKAVNADIKQLFILTTQAEHWFLERGFSKSKLEELPVERQSLYNYQRNSKVLTKKIS